MNQQNQGGQQNNPNDQQTQKPGQGGQQGGQQNNPKPADQQTQKPPACKGAGAPVGYRLALAGACGDEWISIASAFQPRILPDCPVAFGPAR